MSYKEIIDEFSKEMENVLIEKFNKYKDGWKETNEFKLRHLLNKHFANLVIYKDYKDNKKHLEETKRKLIHIVNYCLFLYMVLKKRYNIIIHCENCGYKSCLMDFNFIKILDLPNNNNSLIEKFAIIECPKCNTIRREQL